jgi:signal transduction histidine kinase
MRALSSLRGRIFLASALLAVLSIGAAIYVVSVRATREAENGLHHEILATRALVEQIHQARTETFAMRATLIAGDPRLKAAVDTNDPATVQSVATEHLEQLKSNLLLVTHRSGGLLAAVGAPPGAAQTLARQPAVRNAVAGRESFSLIAQPAGMLQLVTVPIAVGLTNPDILGTLSVGFLLDEDLAAQLKAITGSEIAFAVNGRILATTLPRDDWPALATLVLRADQSQNVMLGAGEYVVLPLALASGSAAAQESGAVALILRSRTEHLRFLRTIHTELAFTAVAAVLLATLLSFVVARTITRPLAAITDAMREVARTGDLTRKIVVRGRRWDDEDARLLATTFNTLTDSIARFQHEISQRERLASLGRLSTVIAHEVRNPLMIIKAALHSLRHPEVGAATLREAAGDIDEEVARLNRIVNEVLDFARPIRFEFAPVDVNALCRESAAAAQATPGVLVELDLDPALGTVTTDAERLRVGLVNLIVNARHAVEARGTEGPASLAAERGRETGRLEPSRGTPAAVAEAPRVLVSTHADRHAVAIVVADNGIGIDPNDLPHVFDPYFTTKRGGTGLGLPIAKNIVEGLGGTLTILGAPGGGTRMRVDLPYTPRSADAATRIHPAR